MTIETILNKATSRSKSLRTTVPISIVKQFNLAEGDILQWSLKAQNDYIVIIVEPRKEKNENNEQTENIK